MIFITCFLIVYLVAGALLCLTVEESWKMIIVMPVLMVYLAFNKSFYDKIGEYTKKEVEKEKMKNIKYARKKKLKKIRRFRI